MRRVFGSFFQHNWSLMKMDGSDHIWLLLYTTVALCCIIYCIALLNETKWQLGYISNANWHLTVGGKTFDEVEHFLPKPRFGNKQDKLCFKIPLSFLSRTALRLSRRLLIVASALFKGKLLQFINHLQNSDRQTARWVFYSLMNANSSEQNLVIYYSKRIQ